MMRRLRYLLRRILAPIGVVEDLGGDAAAFYDGVHVKEKNTRLIAAQAVRDVPQAFR